MHEAQILPVADIQQGGRGSDRSAGTPGPALQILKRVTLEGRLPTRRLLLALHAQKRAAQQAGRGCAGSTPIAASSQSSARC
jgi:hypothetical protein